MYQEGPRDAKLVLVGEAPGSTEVLVGKPFQGGSGQLLTKLLGQAGFYRDSVYLTNLCHTQPPGNDFNWFFEDENRQWLKEGLAQLKEDLEAIRPSLVVALGNWPLWALTGRQGITNWRGSILDSEVHQGRVLATFHPAAALRTYEYKHIIKLDLERAYTLLHTGFKGFPPQRTLIADPEPAARTALTYRLLEAKELAIDIECTRGANQLICVGFAASPDLGISLPWPEASAEIKLLCEAPMPKVLQNGTFDLLVLRKHGIELNNFKWDTMLAYHAINPECASGEDELRTKAGPPVAFGKGLDFLTSIYTLEPFYKKSGKTGDLSVKNQSFDRGAIDAAVTMEIRQKEEEDLREVDTLGWFRETMRLVPVLADMTTKGIKIDLAGREAMAKEIQGEIQLLQDRLDLEVGRPINVKSTAAGGDMRWLVYQKLGLPHLINRDSGNPTTDKEALVQLSQKYDAPLLNLALSIRERRDILERYLRTPVDPDGRMRCTWDLAGTVTTRLSSRATSWGTGTNLQNQPDPIRRVFVPDPGHCFVYADYSQAEARVVAYLAHATGLIELFNDPSRDVHKENAARIFGVPVDEVTPSQRYLAKRAVHALNYGMEPARFVEVVNTDSVDHWGRPGTGITISLAQAEELSQKYFDLYPEIKSRFWREVEQSVSRSRTLETPFGAKRFFYGRYNRKLLKEAYATIPQATIGQLCRIALRRIGEEGRPFGLTPLATVHDSILCQVPIDSVELGVKGIRTLMDIPIPIHGMELRVPVDVATGNNWGHHDPKHPDSNPGGLKKWTA